MYCTRREHLVARYESALRTYRAAVQGLKDQYGAEFEEASREVDDLHHQLEAARDELDRHSREHRCGYGEVGSAADA
jgi:hypothetical protein